MAPARPSYLLEWEHIEADIMATLQHSRLGAVLSNHQVAPPHPWCCCLGACHWHHIIPKHITTPFGRFWKNSKLSIIQHVSFEFITTRQPRGLRKAFGRNKTGGRNCCCSGTRQGCEPSRQAAPFEARQRMSTRRGDSGHV